MERTHRTSNHRRPMGGRGSRRGGGGRPAAPAFTPAALGSKLTLWTDERDLTVVGSKYSAWANQAAATPDLVQGTDAMRPSTGRTVNGYAAPDFDRTATQLFSGSPAAVSNVITASAYHLFAVVLLDSVSSTSTGVGGEGLIAESAAWWGLNVRNDGGTIRTALTHTGGSGGSAIATGLVAGAAALIEASYDGATLRCRVGAGTEATAASGNVGGVAGTLRLFAGWTAGTFADGLCASVLICNERLSAGEIANVRSYIGAKYAVAV